MCNDDDDENTDDVNDNSKIINMDDLDDLIDCDKELKLNDPLLSFPLFDTPPSSSHSSSVPSSPSSMSSSPSVTSSSPASKRSKRSCVKDSSTFELSFGSDDEFDIDSGNDEKRQQKRKKIKYHSSTSTSSQSSNECINININDNRNDHRTSALNLKDPMMSTSHSPSHFSNDLNYMDSMFFSSQYLSPSLSADDSIDLCAILKTEYDHDTEIMIG